MKEQERQKKEELCSLSLYLTFFIALLSIASAPGLSLSLSFSLLLFPSRQGALSHAHTNHPSPAPSPAMEPPEYGSDDLEARGLHSALATVCALEQRLRSAIQASVPISRSLELDPDDADREREALLSTR